MLRFLPLAIAVSLAGVVPVSALTVVKVDDRAAAVAAPVAAPATKPTLAAIGLLPDAMPEQANWAFLFGGIALIVALRLGRGQANVSN